MKKAASLILTLVICFALCACGGNESEAAADSFTKPDDFAMVMLVSINPQIRLYLDENGIVLAIEPVNEDARKIVVNIAFADLDYQKVVSEVISVANSQGFIKGNADVEFQIVENKNDKMDADEVLEKSSESAKDAAEDLGISVEVVSKPYAPENTPDHVHSFEDATCTAPKTCKTCGATEGDAKDHDWQDATCAAPKTCKTCGATEGDAKDHDWQDATCAAPKTCKICGVTDGETVDHNYQNGVCGSCESWQFGYGKWQFFRVEGDTLYIVSLNGNAEGVLMSISNSHYQDVDTVPQATKDQYLQAGAELVAYEGKSYLPIGGLGDPCFFEVNGEEITVHLGEQGASMGEYIVLQRAAKDQFAVKQIVGCTAYGISAGAVFTHKSGS